jgi:hypothetical protein
LYRAGSSVEAFQSGLGRILKLETPRVPLADLDPPRNDAAYAGTTINDILANPI